MQRRHFLQTLAAAPLLAAAPATPIRLGFDTYSLRAFGWKSFELIDYAVAQGLDTIQFSSLDDFASLEPAHLKQVAERAARAGITIDGGTGCICPVSKSWTANLGTPELQITQGLEAAHHVGATSMRCYMGNSDDRQTPEQLERCMDSTIQVFRKMRSRAQNLNVKIALENHAGDMTARETLAIIEQSGKDFVASCLDTGNPMWVMENPLTTMEVLGPYVVTTHVRDCAVFETPTGAAAQWVALGDGVVDLPQVVALHRQLCPQASMQLEIITGRPPRLLPYLQPDFWRNFAHLPAADFARFVRLAKQGHPFMGTMVIEDAPGPKNAVFTGALREQQRVDLERSFAYAKSNLGVGVRARA